MCTHTHIYAHRVRGWRTMTSGRWSFRTQRTRKKRETETVVRGSMQGTALTLAQLPPRAGALLCMFFCPSIYVFLPPHFTCLKPRIERMSFRLSALDSDYYDISTLSDCVYVWSFLFAPKKFWDCPSIYTHTSAAHRFLGAAAPPPGAAGAPKPNPDKQEKGRE